MKLKNLTLLITSGVLMAGATKASAQLFTPGDLIVSTYGSTTNTSITDGEITPITLEEYSLPTPTSTSLVLTDTLPTTGTGANVGVVGEDGSSSEGTLQLSGNGEYLTIGGYDGNAAAKGIQAATNTANGTNFAAGTAWSTSTVALGQSADTDVPRVAVTINANGNVNTSTVLNDIYNTNNPRSVYSTNGTSFYISGQGAGTKVNGVYTDQGGIYATTSGTNTTTGGTAPTGIFNGESTRTVQVYNGNLYYSADQNSKKGVLTGVFEYSGTPTTSQGASTGTRLTPASEVVGGKTINFSPQGFAFANATTMYVADTGDPKAGGTGDGGIQKWSFSSLLGTWTLDYTLTDANFVSPTQATSVSDGQTGFEALTLNLSGGNVDIYAVSYTAGDADPNGLYGIVDNLSATTLPTGLNAETFTELEAAPGTSDAGGADYNFKGVAFAPVAAPEPTTTSMLILALLGCGAYSWKRKKMLKA
jgi:hypothetical protein